MKILVLLGGDSPEREVSLRSAEAVSKALQQAGHEVMKYDPADGHAGLADFVGKVDCVFPILHGIGGEDGVIQAELEKLGFEYLGSNSQTSKLCFDKVLFKQELGKLSIATPQYAVVTKQSFINSPLSAKPYVLKPIANGSGIDMFINRNPTKTKPELRVFDNYENMLLEELIVGPEITIAVLGDKALPTIEIIPPSGEEFDYENKYNGRTQELCPPKNISEEVQKHAQQLAERIHAAVSARHLSRTDMMVNSSGQLFVLDFNTMPGLTDQSLFPKAAQAAGLTMPELAGQFIKMATGVNI